MEFGVTVLPDPPFSRWLELIQLAERHGVGYAWTYDSHVLWQESVPMLAVAARETSTIKLGHFVTNPATRDPTVLASAYATLQDLSDGRMAMGIGRGDSAVRYIGRQPMKVAEFERACAMVRELMNGGEVQWNDKQLQFKWVRPELPTIPMWIHGYGADGSAVPKALTDYVQARKFYDYKDHSRVGAAHGEFVTDEICDRFCVLGTAEQAKAKLQELQGIGVDQFNIYLMTHAQEQTLEAFGDEIIPELAATPA